MTKLKWLLVRERINFTTVKHIFKCFLKENVPGNLQIQIWNSNWSLSPPNKATVEYTKTTLILNQ